MSKIVKLNNYKKEIVGEKVGTVAVSMYKEKETGLPFFGLNPDNEDVLQLSYIIEDTLYKY